MSDQHSENPEFDNNLEAQDVAEIVGDDAPMDQEDNMEIDMRNNSSTYFDQHKDSVYLVASHPELPLVVSGGGDDLAYLWTTVHTPPKVAAKLEGHTESVVCGAFTANGKFLITGDMSGRSIVWKASKTGEKWTQLSNTQEVDEIVNISVHPTLSMFAASSSDGQVWVYEITDDVANVSVLSAHTLPTTATRFLPSGQDGNNDEPKLLSISEDGNIISWDVYAQKAEYILDPTKLRGEHAWISMTLSPTNKTVAVGGMDGIVAIIKLADGAVLHSLDTTVVKAEREIEQTGTSSEDNEASDNEEEQGFSIEGIDWSSTGSLATGNVDGVVVVWDSKTWRPRFTFQMSDAVTQLRFVPNTRLLTVSSMDGTVVQYDVISSERVWEMLGHGEGVLGFAVQDNGKRIITAGDDHVCLIFNKPEKE